MILLTSPVRAATVTSKANGAWSTGSTWDSDPAIPVNGDAVIVNHAVTDFDVDMSGWANGITLTINSGGTLICTTAAGTYYLMTSADITLNGILQAGTSTAVPLPATATFEINFNGGGGSIVAGGTGRIYFYCVKPTNKYVRLSGAEVAGQTELSVDTDVTADTWAVGDTVRIDDNTTTIDSEDSTIAAGGIAAGTITIDDVLAADKVEGAYLSLMTRNIRIDNSTDYAIKNLTHTSGADDASWIECEISTALGTINCAMTTFNYCTFDGCNFPSRTNYKNIYSHCVFSSNANVTYLDYSHIFNNCFFSAFGTGFGTSYSSILNSCIFNGGTNGLGSAYDCTVNNCTFTGVLRAENLCTKNTFNTCEYPGCAYAIYVSYNSNYYNCDFSGATTENYGYNNVRAMASFYSESSEHDEVANAFKAWCMGGIVTSQTADPPTGYTTWYERACESASYPCFRQYETMVAPGETLVVSGLIRIADGEDLSAYPPFLAFADFFGDPLVDSTKSYLDISYIPQPNGALENGWQPVSCSYQNDPDGSPMKLLVRMLAMHATADVDECIKVIDMPAQVSAIYLKLPTNHIMGSSDVDDHDTEIDSIATYVIEIIERLKRIWAYP